MHPLVSDLSALKDQEIEARITDLTKKYFMTHNVELRAQISSVLDSYNEEIKKRQKAALDKMMESRDKSLDKLIKVS